MNPPEIVLSASTIAHKANKIIAAKKLLDFNAFIVNLNQPYYFQDRSTGGPWEIVWILPQLRAYGAGEYRARSDIKWITGALGTFLGNIEYDALDELEDIRFEIADINTLKLMFKNNPVSIDIEGIPAADKFTFSQDISADYILKASLNVQHAELGILELVLVRNDGRYILVCEFAS